MIEKKAGVSITPEYKGNAIYRNWKQWKLQIK